jgi:uncharacterized membrane-anchored protein
MTVVTTAKPWWASKTLWANGIAVIAAGLTITGVADLTPEMQAEIVAVIIGGVNIALRFVTKDAITS